MWFADSKALRIWLLRASPLPLFQDALSAHLHHRGQISPLNGRKSTSSPLWKKHFSVLEHWSLKGFQDSNFYPIFCIKPLGTRSSRTSVTTFDSLERMLPLLPSVWPAPGAKLWHPSHQVMPLELYGDPPAEGSIPSSGWSDWSGWRRNPPDILQHGAEHFWRYRWWNC